MIFRFFCIWLFLQSYVCFSQNILRGKVVDDSGKPIPYANIGIPNKNLGTYSFEDGTFELEVKKKFSNDSLHFSALGFKTRSLLLSKLIENQNQIIVLSERSTRLNEVVISNRNLTEKYGVFKKNSDSNINVKSPYGGAEVALLIQPKKLPFIIEKIKLNVKGQHLESYKIRAKLYDVEKKSRKPNNLIYDSDIIASSSLEKGTLSFILEEKISMNIAFYLSFEWLVEKELANKLIGIMKKENLVIISNLKSHYEGYGVVLYDQKEIQIESSLGHIIEKIKLSKADKKYLKELNRSVPKLYFQTTKNNVPTYYRSKSHGLWYKYQQSLVAGVIGHSGNE